MNAVAKEWIVARQSHTLEIYGVDVPAADFVDALVDQLHDMYPAFSVDELLVRPREAIAFCDAARRRIKNWDVPDDLILRPLLNRRKRPG